MRILSDSDADLCKALPYIHVSVLVENYFMSNSSIRD